MIKWLTNITVLSILIFFSISFFTVFNDLHSPFFELQEGRELSIGFPFTYYIDFQVNDSPILNAGWNVTNLVLDCLLTWLSVLLIAFLSRKYFKK